MRAILLLIFLIPVLVHAQTDVSKSIASNAGQFQTDDSIQHIIDKYKVENKVVTYVTF